MGSFISNTEAQQKAMLLAAGYESFDELFSSVPTEVLAGELDLPAGLSELEAIREMKRLAGKNKVYDHVFRGAGCYDHYIPAIVKQVVSKEEFMTAYTPYQAEISQGNLQTIFEYQTMMCELTGLDVSNASVYDGAVAAAESIFMCTDRKKKKVLVSATVDPMTLEVMKTYCFGRGTKIETVPEKEGVTDVEALKSALDENTACFLMQQPNYYGIIEDAEVVGKYVHEAGSNFIMSVYPTAMALLRSPGECGADIAVGEGQPLGMPMSFGGPYLGFMTASKKFMRKLPGRIVGQTEDKDGNTSYVLTLQAREQHIRREKAGSNICSNEALCALTAAVYLSAMGTEGLKKAAALSAAKAHYLRDELKKAGLDQKYPEKEFFNEFVTECPVNYEELTAALASKGILGGLELADGSVLWCATEKNSAESIDVLIETVKEVLAK